MSNGATKRTLGAAMDSLDSYVAELREKQAADQGDVDTSHPSKSVDNGTVPATEGARSAENEKDVKRDVPGDNINEASPEEANQAPKMDSLTTAALTGKDPANETAGTKDVKDEPGTSHPAKADVKTAAEVVDGVIAEYGVEKVASELIGMVREDLGAIENTIKEAAVAGEQAAIAEEIAGIDSNLEKFAASCADELAGYYQGLIEGHQKKEAMEGEEEAEEPVPGDAGGEGALPPEDLEQLAAAAAQPEMEEDLPPEEAMEEAAMGEEGEVIDALSEALAEAGVTPEELAMAVEAEQAAAPGPEEGGLPIEEKLAIADNAKVACAKVNEYRNLRQVGRADNVKKASLKLKYSMRKLVKEATGK